MLYLYTQDPKQDTDSAWKPINAADLLGPRKYVTDMISQKIYVIYAPLRTNLCIPNQVRFSLIVYGMAVI